MKLHSLFSLRMNVAILTCNIFNKCYIIIIKYIKLHKFSSSAYRLARGLNLYTTRVQTCLTNSVLISRSDRLVDYVAIIMLILFINKYVSYTFCIKLFQITSWVAKLGHWNRYVEDDKVISYFICQFEFVYI